MNLSIKCVCTSVSEPVWLPLCLSQCATVCVQSKEGSNCGVTLWHQTMNEKILFILPPSPHSSCVPLLLLLVSSHKVLKTWGPWQINIKQHAPVSGPSW